MVVLAPTWNFNFREVLRTMILSVFWIPTLVFCLIVVHAKNTTHSILFLIPVFCNTSGLILLLCLDFFALIFPVVSFLFGVMMFHIQIANIHKEVLHYLPIILLPTQRNTTSLRYTVYDRKVEVA
uniref:Uncharacterized protein n=1 Tax=Solanum lycopersicum TaxID=4081 RepID=K4CZT7_SOLLC